jgi:MFS family permease
MRNWRTTIAGFVLSVYPIVDAVMQAYTAGYFTDKTGSQLWMGIGFIVLGVLAKDHNVSGAKIQSIGGTIPPPDKDEK